MDRLPYGIEECRYINLTSDEGYKYSHFKPIVPENAEGTAIELTMSK